MYPASSVLCIALMMFTLFAPLQDPSIQVRQKFLLKVHQYSKERSLHQKYACVFALVAVDPSKEIVTDVSIIADIGVAQIHFDFISFHSGLSSVTYIFAHPGTFIAVGKTVLG